MHLVETYASECGAKIREPYIYEVFYPTPEGKYITFHTHTRFNSKNYDYWQDVIDILLPVLQPFGIQIIQTGAPNDPMIQGVIDFRGRTSVNQLAYILKRSSLHFGSDSLGIHLASAFDIPLVGLYSIISPENAGPYFGSKEKQIVFKCYERLKQKPSFALEEVPKSINTVYPEEIAAAIFKLLGINVPINFRTVHIGDGYGKIKINDFIPNQVINLPDKNAILDVRMDYFFNEQALIGQLRFNKCRIFTNKPINLDILRTYKPSIESLYYFIEENDDPAFIKNVAALGLQAALLCGLPQEQIDAKKINYYEHGSINVIPKMKLEILAKLRAVKNLHFKSCRTVHSKSKTYATRASEQADVPKTTGFQPVIDSPAFWDDEADNCMFVEILP